MAINAVYQALVGNIFFSGIAAAILIFVLFRRATAVAQSGDKAKMATRAVAPGLMVLTAVIVTGAVVGIALPRLQAVFTSQPVQNALTVGNTITAAADGLLFGDYSGDFEVPTQSGGMVANLPAVIEMIEPAEQAESASTATNIDELNAEGILEHYDPTELFGDAGNIRKGMQLAAVKVLFGGDAKNAGTPRRTPVRVLEIIKDRAAE